MKVAINIQADIQEIEVIINCMAEDENVQRIVSALDSLNTKLCCRRQGELFQIRVRNTDRKKVAMRNTDDSANNYSPVRISCVDVAQAITPIYRSARIGKSSCKHFHVMVR